MKKLTPILYICIIGLTAWMSSCSSSRKASEMPLIGGLAGMDYVEKVIELSPSWQSLSGKVALNLTVSQEKAAKVNATLRLKRGESIQLSVAPLLGIEVARLEISPDGILALDRMNKRYVQVPFEEVSEWAHADLDFSVIQSLFLNELFVPGKSHVEATDADAFRVSLTDGRALLETKGGKRLTYRFFTSTDQGLLQESQIGVSGTPYTLFWKYDAFRALEGRSFPEKMNLSVSGVNKPLNLDMKFSRLSVGGEWEARTEIPSRYTKVSIDELLKMLTSQ